MARRARPPASIASKSPSAGRSLPVKLARPSAAGVVARERLFAQLDAFAEKGHRAVWVAGPPGSGKTALLASYLGARGVPHGWYQLDEGDRDPASLFFHLSTLAAQLAPRRRKRLPSYTPEYRAGLAAFSRRFFEAFFARIPEHCVIVLDDLHLVPAGAEIWEMLGLLIAAVPERRLLAIASRSDPPATLARERANGNLALLDGRILRLDRAETAAVVGARGGRLSRKDLAQIEAQTQGWAAGLVLLLEADRLGGEDATPGAPPEALFDYFASEVLARMAPDDREALLTAALFQHLPESLVVGLDTEGDAVAVLRELAARHYFTEVLPGDDPGWRLHPLFHAFLGARARLELPESARQRQLRAGGLRLWERGELEAAAAALIEAADGEQLAGICVAEAKSLIESGRGAMLLAWLDALPASAAERDPWLDYWRGRALLPVSPESARPALARAQQAFAARDDTAGAALALAELLDTFFYVWDSYLAMDPWLERLEAMLAAAPALPTSVEVRLVPSAFRAFLHRRPDNPLLARLLARLDAQLASDDPAAVLAAASCQAEYYVWMGPVQRAESAVAAARAAAARAGGGVLADLPLDVAEAILLWHTQRGRESMQLVDRSLVRAREAGLHLLDARLLSQGAYAALSAGDLAANERYLAALERAAPARARLERGHMDFLRCWSLAWGGGIAAADAALEAVHAVNLDNGFPFAWAITGLFSAILAGERGDAARADERLAGAEALARGMGSQYLRAHAALVRANLAYDRDDAPAGRAALYEGMAGLVASGLRFNAGFLPGWMTRLCVHALREGVEIELAREWIRRHDLAPAEPPLDVPDWPWEIEVRSFGGLEVRRDGVPLRATRKTQQRPLALLKALVAFGGRDVSASALCEALWPDADGDRARTTLGTTLHRLRKLLGSERAITLQDGRVGLDACRVWLDTWALDRRLERDTGAGSEADLEAALALYTGPFLAGDDAGWLLPVRERRRVRIVRAVRNHAAALERAGECERASAWYERGLEVDPLAEGLWQRLMVCHRELGRPAEALAAYERCRAALARGLGVEPAAETRALAIALRG